MTFMWFSKSLFGIPKIFINITHVKGIIISSKSLFWFVAPPKFYFCLKLSLANGKYDDMDMEVNLVLFNACSILFDYNYKNHIYPKSLGKERPERQVSIHCILC